MPEMINPLRYPGAKRLLFDYIDRLLTSNNLCGCRFYEPYAGSATVGLELLRKGKISTLILCEKDILLYAFWKCVFDHTDELCTLINETPITVKTWMELEHYRHIEEVREDSIVKIGFSGLFFNRTNFSGILNANPIGGIGQKSRYSIDCRFNKEKIIRVIQDLGIYREFVSIHYDDALNFMKLESNKFLRENCFAYFDPPYYEQGKKIYRHFYKDQDHIALAQYVSQLHHLNWIISYDDAPFICALYSGMGAQYRPFFMDYSCANKVRTRGQELLISNLPLPPFPIKDVVGF